MLERMPPPGRRRERGPRTPESRPAPRTPEPRPAPRTPEHSPTPAPRLSRRERRRLSREYARAHAPAKHHITPVDVGYKAVGATGGIIATAWGAITTTVPVLWKEFGYDGEFWKVLVKDLKEKPFWSKFGGGDGGGGH